MRLAWPDQGDLVIVLGKGHETGHAIKGENIPFDDRLVLASAIAGAS
ncbi:MAG: hypothetical protein WDO06_10025 [Actinomycetota bacterium]